MAEINTSGAVGFTPGPWTVDGCSIIAPGYIVATVHWHSGAAHDKPNCRLIAAAPEMYATLQGIADMEHSDTCSNSLSPEYDCDCHVVLAQAAVAKATPPLSEHSVSETPASPSVAK